MVDGSGKLFNKISLLDIFIILAVAALVIGFLYSQLTEQAGVITAPTDVFYVTFETDRLRAAHAAVLEEGDIVFRQHSGQPFGIVTDIARNPATDIIKRSDGTVVQAVVEGRYMMVFTVRVNGNITSIGYFVNGNDHVAVGSPVVIVSGLAYFHDSIVSKIADYR